jgi:hypothetical protein
MKLMLCNDTGLASHVGCMAVSDAHARMLGRAGHRVVFRHFLGSLGRFRCGDAAGIRNVLDDPVMHGQLAAVDAVVVNGEGSIHHGAGTEYLAVLGAAQQLGKLTFLVNSVFQDVFGFEDVLRKLTDFTVRERRSRRFAESLGIHCRVVPDSCLEAAFEAPAPLDLAGKRVVTDWHHQRDPDVGQACLGYLAREPEKCFFLPLYFGDADVLWPSFPAMLAGAEIIITGRHHGLYLAALARRPFIPLSSNTFKVEGLLDDFPEICAAAPHVDAVTGAVEWALEHRSVFERFAEHLLAQRPLSTFAGLGGSNDPDGETREIAKLQADVQAHWASSRPDLTYLVQRRSDEMRLAARHGAA